jgi:ACS family allantoate permease-like MFS transporter
MDEVSRVPLYIGLRSSETIHSSLNIFVWAIALCSHAACKNFAGLFVVRLILGMCEGSITAGFMIVSSMFYTRREHTVRVGYWCE